MPRPVPPEGGAAIPPGSTPARHADPRIRSDYPRGADGLQRPALLSLGDIEERLMRCDEELEQLAQDHFHAAEEAANAKADWEGHRDRILVLLADQGDKESADIRLARAKRAHEDPRDPQSPLGEDLYRTHLVLSARETSIDRQIKTIQTRATSMMAVAKGIRPMS